MKLDLSEIKGLISLEVGGANGMINVSGGTLVGRC
jgi:hypothetical protein